MWNIGDFIGIPDKSGPADALWKYGPFEHVFTIEWEEPVMVANIEHIDGRVGKVLFFRIERLVLNTKKKPGVSLSSFIIPSCHMKLLTFDGDDIGAAYAAAKGAAEYKLEEFMKMLAGE